MKKNTVILIGAAAVLVLAAAVLLYRHRGGDIIGVTTYPEQNQVIANMTENNPYVSGQGVITVGEGQRLHVEYALSAGKCDIVCKAGSDVMIEVLDSATSVSPEELPVPEDWQSWEEQMADGNGSVFGESGLTGTGSRDFEADPGRYTVYFYPHDAVGKVTVSVKAG